ncbi:MAG TPA: SgcJ/EcaC family oxidoreductase [Burkholderiales bacterium]|nr:SgcJ/EcaC family oxidoreductase [Burkholderiales bacterium]
MSAMTKAAGLLCTIVAFAVFSTQSLAADSAKDLAALQAADQNWAKAYNAGNAEALANLYDEHAVLLPPGAPSVNGRAAIKAFFVKDTAESQKAGVTLILNPKPAGGVAGAMGWQSGTYTAKDKAGKVVETGKYLSVSMKKDGKWLYVRDTWNSDGAPAAVEPVPPAKK